jgi:anti-sigma regulatory factor (Ser/Thr protein kinase)
MSTSEPAESPFRHEALFYQGVDGFVAGTAGFVREGLGVGEAVLVAVIAERARALREELSGDAAAVEFLDVAELGRNPARIIPAWWDWVERNTARGTAFRGVGELLWDGRSELEIRECRTHEHLIGTAFGAGSGPGWTLLCPYDAASLPAQLLDDVAGAHPVVHGRSRTVDQTPGARAVPAAPAGPATAPFTPFDIPLPELGPPLYATGFGAEQLPALRVAVKERADRLGLRGREVADFVLVADELACNSVMHGGGRGTLALWAQDAYAVCEVRDAGLIRDPLVGRRRPDLRSPLGGAGLWTANQLCDLVLIHSTPADGTAVRAYLRTR